MRNNKPLKLAKALGFLTIFSASFALAETGTFQIEGMTCNGCVKNIEGSVCKKMDNLEKCEVKVGSMVLTSKKGQNIDVKKAEQLVDQAGYKVIKSEIK